MNIIDANYSSSGFFKIAVEHGVENWTSGGQNEAVSEERGSLIEPDNDLDIRQYLVDSSSVPEIIWKQ